MGEALNNLVTEHPDLRKHLFAEDGKLRSFVNVYLNDEDIRYLAKDATPANESDTITIVPSVAGGMQTASVFLARESNQMHYRRSKLATLNETHSSNPEQ